MKKKLVGMDIGSRRIKLVSGIIKKGVFKFEGYEIIKTPAGAFKEDGTLNMEAFFGSNPFEDELASAIAKLGGKNCECHLCLSSSGLIIRERKFPPVGRKEMGQIVKMEAQNFLLGVEEDYIIDYKVIDEVVEEGSPMFKCIVAATPRNIVESYMELAEECGMKLMSIDIHSSCMANYAKRTLLDEESSTLIVDIGSARVRFVIFSGTEYFAEIEVSSAGVVSEGSFYKLGQEVRRVMDYYRTRKFGSQIDKILITGGFSNEAGIAECLYEETRVPIKKIDVPPEIERLAAEKEKVAKDYSMLVTAIGAVLRGAR